MAHLMGSLLFSVIGMTAFVCGKRLLSFKVMLIGLLLMVYPYVVSSVAGLYGIGIVLTALLFVPFG